FWIRTDLVFASDRYSLNRVRMLTDADLYQRGLETLIASWEAYAACASGASVQRLPGVTAAIFPCEPERGIYNNAVLARDLDPRPRVGPRVGRVNGMRPGATRLHPRYDDPRDGHVARRYPPAPSRVGSEAAGLVRLPAGIRLT